MKKIYLAVGIVLLLLIALVGTVGAVEGLELPWGVIGAGGEHSAGGDFELDGSMGQPTGGVTSGGAFNACTDFWCGFLESVQLYIPLIYH